MSDQMPQLNQNEDEISVEELENVSGGGVPGSELDDGPNTNCGVNCGCGATP
jgi:hypothetical protein